METASNDTDSSSYQTSSSFPNFHVTSSYGCKNEIDNCFSRIFMGGKNNSEVKADCSMVVRGSDSLNGLSGSNEDDNEMDSVSNYDKNLQFYMTFHQNEKLIDHYGNTPLYWAAYYGNMEGVQRLVEGYKFPVNWQNFSGDTALSAAVKENNVEIFEYLLEHGANPNVGNASEETPLHFGACMGNMRACEALLKFGAYVDVEDEYGETPLHWAVREECMEVIDLLLLLNADPNHMNEDGESPEMLAKIIGRSDIFDSAVQLPTETTASLAGEDFDMMDVEDYMTYPDSEENSATVIPSSIEEKSYAFMMGYQSNQTNSFN